MFTIQLNHQKAYQWFEKNNIFVKGFLLDNEGNLYSENSLIQYFSAISKVEEFEQKLKQSNGLFSIIIKKENLILLATDITRTFPIFYTKYKDGFIISDDAFYLQEIVNNPVDLDSEKEFLSCGYVTGNKTLISNILQVQAGEFLKIENEIYPKFYWNYSTEKTSTKSFKQLKNKLIEIFDNVSNRLIKIANGNQIILPLSGGYDSRLLAYMLKSKNYTNVLCFTYGKKNSKEVNTAKKIINQLNFDWHFIEYTNELMKENYLLQEDNCQIIRILSNMVTMPHTQNFVALRYLIKNQLIDKNAIFIPGHTGDFIAGKHLLKTIFFNKKKLVQNIIENHFNLNTIYSKSTFFPLIKQQIQINTNAKHYSIEENWNQKERQSKFIINTNKIYEYYNFKHLLPLWDKELVDFFKEVPLKYKMRRNLYDYTITSEFFTKYNIDFQKTRAERFNKNYYILFLKKIIKTLLPKMSHRLAKLNFMKNTISDENNFSIEKKQFEKYFNNSPQSLDINYIYAKVFLNLLKNNKL